MKRVTQFLNKVAVYHYDMCLDNWGAKTKNKLSYQELIFMISEIDYNNEKPYIYLDKNENKKFKDNFFTKYKITNKNKIFLLNTGCGPVYPHKKVDKGWIH